MSDPVGRGAPGGFVGGIFTYYYASISRINDDPIQPVGNAAASSAVLVQFAVVVLATVAVTSEYSTGSVRASLLWVPRRDRVQAAKALVAAVVAFVAGTVFAVMGTTVAWVAFDGRASHAIAVAVRDRPTEVVPLHGRRGSPSARQSNPARAGHTGIASRSVGARLPQARPPPTPRTAPSTAGGTLLGRRVMLPGTRACPTRRPVPGRSLAPLPRSGGE